MFSAKYETYKSFLHHNKLNSDSRNLWGLLIAQNISIKLNGLCSYVYVTTTFQFYFDISTWSCRFIFRKVVSSLTEKIGFKLFESHSKTGRFCSLYKQKALCDLHPMPNIIAKYIASRGNRHNR